VSSLALRQVGVLGLGDVLLDERDDPFLLQGQVLGDDREDPTEGAGQGVARVGRRAAPPGAAT
jgi:hypothetical protein